MDRNISPERMLRVLTADNIKLDISEYGYRLKIAKSRYSYAFLSLKLGVNQFYLWSIINDSDYYPPDWVCRILGIVKYKRPRRVYIYPDPEHIENTVRAIRRNMSPTTIELLIERLIDG